MSQNPSPYLPPSSGPTFGYGHSPDDPLSPARRASVLMVVMGTLMLLYGLCNGGVTLMTSNEQLMQQMQAFTKEAPPFSIGAMRTATVIFCGIVVLLAVFLIAASGFVRRGESLAITLTLIGVIGIVCLLGLFTLLAVLVGFAQPVIFAFACVFAIPTALFALLLTWLIQARRGVSRMRWMQGAYQQQYMQYQQTMQQYGQQYGQTGYGYSYPPPPAPPPSPGPPEDPK